MRCIYCESDILDGDLFCQKCGKAVQMVPDYNEFEEDYIHGLIGDTSKEKARRKKAKQKELAKQKKIQEIVEKQKKQKKILIALLSTVVIALIVMVFIFAENIRIKNNNSIDYQLSKAHEAVDAGNIDKAIDYYEQAIKLDNENNTIKMELAKLLEENGNDSGAIILYKEIIELDFMNKDAYTALIKYYEEKKDYDSIIELSKGVKNPKIKKLFDSYIVTPPIFNVEGGEYEESLKLKLSSTSLSDIYYSFDDDDPYKNGEKFSKEIVFDEEGEYKITAVCINSKGFMSDTVTEEYTIISSAPDMPCVTPDGGSFISDTKAYVDVPENCNAYYTWNGADPTIESELYVDGIDIPEGNNVLSVILVNEKGKESEVYKNRFEYYKPE